MIHATGYKLSWLTTMLPYPPPLFGNLQCTNHIWPQKPDTLMTNQSVISRGLVQGYGSSLLHSCKSASSLLATWVGLFFISYLYWDNISSVTCLKSSYNLLPTALWGSGEPCSSEWTLHWHLCLFSGSDWTFGVEVLLQPVWVCVFQRKQAAWGLIIGEVCLQFNWKKSVACFVQKSIWLCYFFSFHWERYIFHWCMKVISLLLENIKNRNAEIYVDFFFAQFH